MRKKGIIILITIMILLVSTSFSSYERIPKQHHSQKRELYAEGQVLLKFRPEVSEDFIKFVLFSYRTKKLNFFSENMIYQLQLSHDSVVEETVLLMKQNPFIEIVEPNYYIYTSVVPNDTQFPNQYALFNLGGTIPVPGAPQGKERADIKAPEGWSETLGDQDIIIAVIDTGIDLLHPDLQNKIVSGGRDFINGDFDATDDNGHGTQVAGIAGAETNNRRGIAGVAWNCRILPIKALDANGVGTTAELIQAIEFATNYDNGRGVDVINISAGGYGDSELLQTALQNAYNKDIVIVAAAGDQNGEVEFPAAYSTCLAVASTDFKDKRSTFSNFGPEIDIAAPGEEIISTKPLTMTGPGELPYRFDSGTSLAAPHVTGLAALLKSIKPWLTAHEIMFIIQYTADDINQDEFPGQDDFIGYGRINLEKALVPTIVTVSK